MTWVKLPDDALDDPIVAALTADDLLAYLRALAWSNRWARDGAIPRGTAGPSADAWVAAGMAEATDDSVRLVWLIEHQPTADEITARRKVDAERQARRRRHMAGDHSACDPERCRALSSKGKSRRDTPRDTPRESEHPDPTRPDPKGEGGEVAPSGRAVRSAARPTGADVAKVQDASKRFTAGRAIGADGVSDLLAVAGSNADRVIAAMKTAAAEHSESPLRKSAAHVQAWTLDVLRGATP